MKKILSAVISFLGAGLLFSCKSKPVLPTATTDKSLLWEVTGNGLKQPSYFLGTMHLMCAEDAVLSNNVQQLIATTGQVYLEIDMDNASELFSGLMDIMDSKGQPLNELLSAEEYSRVKTFFETHQPGVPFSSLERQPPLMIASMVYEMLLPCEKKNGIELKIIDEAYRHKKETKGLETIAYQAGVFEQIPYREQARDLVKAVDSIAQQRKMMAEMLQVYKQQDIERLYAISIAEDSSISSHEDVMLFDRNANWVKQFPGIATKKATLFAVGAAHLGGEKGVLNLLRKAGYSLRPIANN